MYERAPTRATARPSAAGRSTWRSPSAVSTPCAASGWPIGDGRRAADARPDDPPGRRPARLPALRADGSGRSTRSAGRRSTTPCSTRPRRRRRGGRSSTTGWSGSIRRPARHDVRDADAARSSPAPTSCSAPTAPVRPCAASCSAPGCSTSDSTSSTTATRSCASRPHATATSPSIRSALHIWPRGTSMMIALPNPDRSFTCTLFWPNGGTGCFAALSSAGAIERHFARRLSGLRAARSDSRRRLPAQPGRCARHRARHAVARRRAGRPARRRRPRHRAVLRAGRELRLRGRRRARPLPRRHRRRLGRGAAAVRAAPARATPRRSPTWRWPTSSRCATRSPRRCSGCASGSSTAGTAAPRSVRLAVRAGVVLDDAVRRRAPPRPAAARAPSASSLRPFGAGRGASSRLTVGRAVRHE